MRTTVRLDENLLGDAKRHALETGRTLTDLIRDSLVATLERERGAASPRRIRLITVGGDGVFPGVDLNSSASILDHMDADGG
jgi:hypothetical protein